MPNPLHYIGAGEKMEEETEPEDAEEK